MDKIAERKASYNRYKDLRIEAGIESDYQVAKETGIPKSTFTEWSRGTYEPKIEKKMKIAAFLGMPIAAILGD